MARDPIDCEGVTLRALDTVLLGEWNVLRTIKPLCSECGKCWHHIPPGEWSVCGAPSSLHYPTMEQLLSSVRYVVRRVPAYE